MDFVGDVTEDGRRSALQEALRGVKASTWKSGTRLPRSCSGPRFTGTGWVSRHGRRALQGMVTWTEAPSGASVTVNGTTAP